MFTIQKDLNGIFWHIYNNLKTKVNVSDFDIVIDAVASTFIIQCKNGSNIPSQAISISLIEVVDLSVGTSPIPFSGAAGLIQLLKSLDYTPYLEPPTTPIVIYRVGQVGVFKMTQVQIDANFDGTGLGTNVMLGWAKRNGQNGTIDQRGKFSINQGSAPFATIGASGGNQSYTLLSDNLPSRGVRGVIVGSTNDADVVATNGTVIRNTSDATAFSIMNPHLIDLWVERVTELVVNAGSGGGGGVQTVTGVTVTGTATDRIVGVPNLTQVLTVGDKEFQQIDGDRDFEIADRLKYSLISGGVTMTIDDDLDLFPPNSLIQFFVNDSFDINATATLNIGAVTSCYYLIETITTLTLNVGDFCELKKASAGSIWILSVWNKSSGAGSGTVTSVGLTMPPAFSVANTPVTTAGTLEVTTLGTASQYIDGVGDLRSFPSFSGGGASVSYYLNGSVNQGTFGGATYYEFSKTPVLGAGTDFTINANGYIASFITDANDPAQIEIPAGNWDFEMFMSSSSAGGSPSFYVELYKYNGTTFTLISSSSATPEPITNGIAISLYLTSLAVPQTTLALTDRLAVRVFVNNSSKTIKLHTEDNHLCQIITSFASGLTALNGLTRQIQVLASGTSGADFNISSVDDTHTFNLPTASASNRGALSSTDWSTFNAKASTAYVDAKVTDAIVDGVTTVAPSQNAVFDALQFTRRLITKGTGSVTGTLTETILTSLTIPANTLDSSCFIWSTMDFFKTNSGSVTARLYINSANTLTGATLLGFIVLGSNRNVSFNRKLYLNGTSLDLLTSSASSQVSNEFIELLFGSSTVLTVNPANDIFLIYTTQNDIVGTVATNKMATVQKMKL